MSDTITHEKTPDTHSSIVGGSSASRILGCPGSVDKLAELQASIDAAADASLAEAVALIALDASTMTEADYDAAIAAAEAQAEKMRNSLNESSSYADEGTGLHEIMAYLVENDVDINTLMTDPKVDELWEKYDLHLDRMYDAVVPAYKSFLAYLDTLYETDDDEVRIRVESRVEMPGIEGAFGTCDVLIRAPKKTVVWDWKFGQGVPVLASYKIKDVINNAQALDAAVVAFGGEPQVSETEYGNDQLMFYARAAMETYEDYFDDTVLRSEWPVELVICQPRILEEDLSTFETTVAALEAFRLDLIDAVEEAQSGKGHLKKGSYCRFAKCKSICPLHLNGATALANVAEKLGKLKANRELVASVDNTVFAGSPGAEVAKAGAELEYAEALGLMLTLSEIVEPYINEARTQAHAFMEAGGEVPNWKLVPKRAGWDGWNDREEADSFLSRRKLAVEERRKAWEPITPAVARKLLKSKGDEKGVKLLEKYVKPGVSSGTTIAPSDDPREAVQATATMVAELANKIASL